MKLVIFGLTVTSSWGNSHATLWRGLLGALGRLGHQATFFERDVPFYASQRDLHRADDFRIELYPSWNAVLPLARSELASADAAIVTSYCPDAVDASDLVLGSNVAMRAFYDLDTTVTLDRMRGGGAVEYVPPGGLGGFDLVLSCTGGRALEELRTVLGASVVKPLYGSVDPAIYKRVAPAPAFAADLSYLGTYARDRQPALEALLLQPALALPRKRFVIGGAQYPQAFPWAPNIAFVHHVPPPLHPQFYSSGAVTLNITRPAVAARGYCPSGRLFEAAACAAPIISDAWEGLDTFFVPDREILIARHADDVARALSLGEPALRGIGEAAKARVLAEHSALHRAGELLAHLGDVPSRRRSACAT